MIRTSRKRFQLSSETLRVLADPALAAALGGNLPVLTIIETSEEDCKSDNCSVITIVTVTHGPCK